MKGKQRVYIDTPRIKYDIQIENKISIIRGDSGTGKTTLVRLIRKKHRLTDRVLKITSSIPVKALALDSTIDETLAVISSTENNIIFMDETVEDIKSMELAKLINDSNNYFVIFTRDNLSNIPTGEKAVYEFVYNEETMVNSLVKIK